MSDDTKNVKDAKIDVRDIKFEENIGRKIKEWDIEGVDMELLRTSLMHPSYDIEGQRNNQRLEFLGDAVLGLALAHFLYDKYGEFQEGELTRVRSYLAREGTLAKVAGDIGLGEVMLLGNGEEKDGGRKRPSTLADALESLIAAIYLSFGYEKAAQFVEKNIASLSMDDITDIALDYKTKLQEFAQSMGSENVSYKIISESGPAHLRTFEAAVYYKGRMWGTGKGRTKKAAEKEAAKIAYKRLALGDE